MTVVLGFNTASEVFYEEEFRALGAGFRNDGGAHGIKVRNDGDRRKAGF